MPIHSCEINGENGYKWGDQGHCYPHNGTEESMKKAKKKALAQGYAMGDFSMEEFNMSSEEYTKMEFSTSFDFDGTLSTNAGQRLYMKTKGTKYVITARSKDASQGVYEVTDKLGIPRSRVIFAGSNKEKVRKVNELGIDKHIDNNDKVVKDLGTKGKIFSSRTIITKMKEEKFELDVINKFGRIGRELPNDEEIIYEEELSEFSEELLSEEENNLLEVKFANEKINGLFVYYKYAVKKEVGPKVIPGTRDFCKTLINRNRVYTKDEIVNLGVNDLGTDLWKYRGGFWNQGEGNISPSCRHVWKRILTRKKI